CANVANLFMVRAESRRRDLTVRRAIGASRTQLVRFQMMEAFAVALAAGVLAIVLSAITLPAFRASSPDLSGLREGGRGSTGGRAWGRDMLVVGQTALALVLLIASALLVQSFQRLRHVDPGYDVDNIYTFQFAPDFPPRTTGEAIGQMHLTTMDRIRALPGVNMV